MRTMICALAGALTLAACASAPAPEMTTIQPVAAEPAPPPADARVLPAATDLQVELLDSLSSDGSRVGDLFTVRVHTPIVAVNEQVVVPAGSVITGMVTGVDDSDHIGDQAAIRLNFLRISINGTNHPLSADIVAAEVEREREGGLDPARTASIGAAAGAALGAIISGELRGALIGGALGAGIGTIISLGTGEVEALLPEGARMTIRTRDTIELR